jgi:hypothetical protein
LDDGLGDLSYSAPEREEITRMTSTDRSDADVLPYRIDTPERDLDDQAREAESSSKTIVAAKTGLPPEQRLLGAAPRRNISRRVKRGRPEGEEPAAVPR